MTLLSRNTTPAERARGCVFSELFRDAASVARNGGVPTGAPAIDKGVTLDGSTQYLTYNSVETIFNSSEISFVVEFYPDFDLDSGTSYYFYDSSSGARNLCYITTAGALGIFIGNTGFAAIPKASYQAYWRQSQKNVLVVSSVSGDTDIFINGVQIMTGNATVWAPSSPASAYVGVSFVPSAPFDGRITKFQIYNRKLTAQEAADFYNGTVYDYRNQQSLHLPFGAAQHDPTNVRSLDVSGNGRHATFGDGSTPTTYPTKLGARHGYDFDGGDYLKSPYLGVFGSGGSTIALVFEPNFLVDSGATQYLWDSENGKRYFAQIYGTGELQVYAAQSNIEVVPKANYENYWYKGRSNILVCALYPGNSDIYLNGVQIVANDINNFVPSDPSYLVIGASYVYTGEHIGQINSFQVWPKKLTPLQVADLTIRAGITVNNV